MYFHFSLFKTQYRKKEIKEKIFKKGIRIRSSIDKNNIHKKGGTKTESKKKTEMK